jgi:hypothetical protein
MQCSALRAPFSKTTPGSTGVVDSARDTVVRSIKTRAYAVKMSGFPTVRHHQGGVTIHLDSN